MFINTLILSKPILVMVLMLTDNQHWTNIKGIGEQKKEAHTTERQEIGLMLTS